MELFIKQSPARRPHEIVLWVWHIKWFLSIITRTHRRTNQDEKWFMHASASCFTLGCLWNEPVHEIMVPLAHATSEGSDEPAHPHSLADKKKNGRKSLSFTVRVYSNLQLRFFTQFHEKLFCMQTTKAQISQHTCAVLPIISGKYES